MLAIKFAEAHERNVANLDALHDVLTSDEFQLRYVPTGLNRIEFFDDGTLEVEGERLSYVQEVQESFAKSIRMPLSYGYEIDFDLFKHNFDIRSKAKPTGVTLCVARDNTVVGLAPAEYTPANTLEVLRSIELEDRQLELNRGTVSDFGMMLDVKIPGVTIEPQVGDIIEVGIRLTNSETGGKSMQATCSTVRLECSNGSVIRTNEGVIYWTTHKKRTYASTLKAFVKQMGQLQQAAHDLVADAYQDVIDRPLYDDQFTSLFRTLQRRLRSSDAAEDVLEVDSDERVELQRRVRERDRGEAVEPTRFQLYDVHNRITAAARSKRFSLRQHLEEIGGTLLFSRN